MNSVQIRSFFWSVFSRILTEYLSLFSPNAGKYEPEKTSYLDTFHAVCFWMFVNKHLIYLGCLISKKVNGVIMRNLRNIIFMWRRRYGYIFIYALVYLKKISQKFTGKHLCLSLLFYFIKKEIPTQFFSCRLYEIFKNNFL